jgi:hypothetical protein
MGGLWEAGVKSMKYHLRRVVRKATLAFVVLYPTLSGGGYIKFKTYMFLVLIDLLHKGQCAVRLVLITFVMHSRQKEWKHLVKTGFLSSSKQMAHLRLSRIISTPFDRSQITTSMSSISSHVLTKDCVEKFLNAAYTIFLCYVGKFG